MRRGLGAASIAAGAAVSLLVSVGCGGHKNTSSKAAALAGATSGSTTTGSGSGTTGSGAGSGTAPLPPPAAPVPGGPAITTTQLPNAIEGTFYTDVLTVTGGTTPYRFSLTNGSLPTGLTLDAFTGELSGIPQAPGNRGFTVRVTDDQGLFAEANLFLTVDPIGGAPGTGGPGTGTPPTTPPPTSPPPTGAGTWTDLPQPRLPQPLAAMACAAVNGIVYTFGGLPPQGLTGAIQRFDALNGSLSTAQVALPAPRAYMTAVTVNGKVYLIGGSDDAQIYDECFVFDPSANTLTPIAPMPGERDSVAAAAIGTDIYVFGGATLDWVTFKAVPTRTIYKYDTVQDTWTTLPTTLPQDTQWALALSHNNTVYVIGGCNFEVDLLASTQTTLANYATVYAFNGSALTPRADLPVATKLLVGGVINGQLYVCAGDRTSGVQNNAALWCQTSASTYRYDPAADAWSTLADFETDIPGVGKFGGRALAGGAATNGKLYLFGGYTLPTAGSTAPPCPTQQGEVDGIAEFTP